VWGNSIELYKRVSAANKLGEEKEKNNPIK
jgi:hypothetical protein